HTVPLYCLSRYPPSLSSTLSLHDALPILTLRDVSKEELGYLIQRAIELKTMLRNGQRHEPLRGKTLGMIFEKASTRTRVSFETGDRKSTRLNSSHVSRSYAVFCLKKKRRQ